MTHGTRLILLHLDTYIEWIHTASILQHLHHALLRRTRGKTIGLSSNKQVIRVKREGQMARFVNRAKARAFKCFAVVLLTYATYWLTFNWYGEVAGRDDDPHAQERPESRVSSSKRTVAANVSATASQRWKPIQPQAAVNPDAPVQVRQALQPIQPHTASRTDLVLHANQEVSNFKFPKIFYNRVPKCGSAAAQRVFTWLGRNNNFDYRVLAIYDRYKVSVSEQVSHLLLA